MQFTYNYASCDAKTRWATDEIRRLLWDTKFQ
jgi:hypothetical protein